MQKEIMEQDQRLAEREEKIFEKLRKKGGKKPEVD